VQEKDISRLAKDIIHKITPALTTDFSIEVRSEDGAESKEEKYTHSPDGQYHYPGSRYPVFFVEIGFSQTGKDYEETDGHIKTVLTVDLVYPANAQCRLERRQTGRPHSRSSLRPKSGTTKQASFSLYRGPKRSSATEFSAMKPVGWFRARALHFPSVIWCPTLPGTTFQRYPENGRQ
jgi:hypothetical protein